jgi:hypothetical protein
MEVAFDFERQATRGCTNDRFWISRRGRLEFTQCGRTAGIFIVVDRDEDAPKCVGATLRKARLRGGLFLEVKRTRTLSAQKRRQARDLKRAYPMLGPTQRRGRRVLREGRRADDVAREKCEFGP